jgi:hypothetical protein
MFSHVGTWSDGATTCKVCGKHNQVLIEPLQIEWEDGSVNIGDFSWCSYTAIVLDPVKKWLLDNRFEARFGRVEVKKPTGKARMPRVAFPYKGPNLNWMIPSAAVRLDEERSGIEKISDCPACGQKRTKFTRERIYISRRDWNGQKLFRIEQNGKSSAMFVSEEAANLLRQTGFSNYVLVPAGEIGN